MTKYYIHAEDLACAFVGPFDSIAAANAHITFCEERGDAATMEIMPESDLADHVEAGYFITPEEDRNYSRD